MLRSFFFILTFLAGIVSTAQARPVTVLSYRQCVERALANNGLIRAADQDIEVSKARLQEARPRGIPVIKYESRFAPVPGDVDNASGSFFSGDIQPFSSIKVEAGAPISTFGKLSTAQALANIGIDASWLKRRKTSDEVVSKIFQTYHGILLARNLLGLASQAQKAMSDKIEQLESESTKDQIQILKLKVAVYEVLRKVEEAREKEGLAMLGLKILIGLDQDEPFNIADKTLRVEPFTIRPVEYYLEGAHQYLPDFKLLEKGVAAKKAQLKLEKLKRAPDLGAGAFVDVGRAPGVAGEDQGTFTNPFNYSRAGFGLQLKGEFDFVKTRAKVKQASSDLLKTVYEKKMAEEALELDIRKSYIQLREAKRLMEEAAEAKRNAHQIVFLTKSNLDIGIGDKKDYLDALQTSLVFQGREFEAIYNFNVAVSELKRRVGNLYQDQTEKMP